MGLTVCNGIYDMLVDIFNARMCHNRHKVTTDCALRECRALVLATGVQHRTLGLPGEEELVGQGVSYCAVCDGPFYAGKPAAVVGGGDTALQDALFLSGICSQVTLIHRREEFRGARRLVEGGNTVVVIEHNLDVIKCADHLIDLGPEGGDGGGTIVCTGTPEEVAACPASFTGQYLKKMLER